MKVIQSGEGEGGFPGTWFIENRSVEARRRRVQSLTASYLRLARALCSATAAGYPSRMMSGKIRVSDLPLEKCALSGLVVDDRTVDVDLEIPWSFLLDEQVVQERILSRMMSREVQIAGGKTLQRPNRCTPSPRDDQRVQFIHCRSMFEERERRFSAVPPAAFCMAPALQKKGFHLSVDTVMLEPFVSPGLSPGPLIKENRERLDRILKKRPFCVALTAMDFYLEELRCLLKEIRARDQEVLIALGGPMVTLYPEKAPVYLEEANIFIRGEADLEFAEVLACLSSLYSDRDLSGTESSLLKNRAGLFLRFGDTVLVSNLDRTARAESLDETFQEEVNLDFIKKRHVGGGLHLHTTRGCPFHCSFCTKVHGSHVRAMGCKTIFRLLSSYHDRIEEIRQTEGLSEEETAQAFQVSFSDDDFLLARSRASRFFTGISDAPFRLKTVPAGIPSFLSGSGGGARRFDPVLFDAVSAAKTHIGSFEIGTDDFSGRELSRLAKGGPAGYTLGDIEEVAKRLEQIGVSNRHFLILSNPDTLWSDLFEKLITLEDLCWSYAHFYPDPNPFVLAPVGTPLFSELARQGRVGHLTKKVFEVPDFPEFTHWVFNMASPPEHLFSSERSSCKEFFLRVCDLLKSRCRFTVVDDAYLHYLDVCGTTGFAHAGDEERARILEHLTAAVRLRAGRIVPRIKHESFSPAGTGAHGKGGSLAKLLSGMSLLRATLEGVFPETAFREKRESLLAILDAFFDQMEEISRLRAGQPGPRPGELDQALLFARNQVRLYRAGGCADPVNPLAATFVRKVEDRLVGMGLHGEAREWRGLCSEGTDFVRLDVSDDKQDAGFVEDEARLGRLFALIRIVDSGWEGQDDALRFFRGERVLARSIRDDFLTASDTRVPLYNGIERLPLGFKRLVQQEFTVSAFLDRDGFAGLVLSKFLASRAIPHRADMHGTDLFQGLEEELQGLVPEPLEAFSEWFFGSR